MAIYTSNVIVHGSISNILMYTNELSAIGAEKICVTGDMFVDSNVPASGRLDVGDIRHFFSTSNVPFTTPELQCASGTLDLHSTFTPKNSNL